MTAIVKTALVAVAEVFLSVGVNYFYFFKIFLGMNLDLTGHKGAWSMNWAAAYFLFLFYILFCLKKYICPDEFYDRSIQIIAYAGLYLSMIATIAIGLYAMKSR
jgi:hypothetical protein